MRFRNLTRFIVNKTYDISINNLKQGFAIDRNTKDKCAYVFCHDNIIICLVTFTNYNKYDLTLIYYDDYKVTTFNIKWYPKNGYTVNTIRVQPHDRVYCEVQSYKYIIDNKAVNRIIYNWMAIIDGYTVYKTYYYSCWYSTKHHKYMYKRRL